MPRSCLPLVCLLAVLAATRGIAQTVEQPGAALFPPVGESPQPLPSQTFNAVPSQVPITTSAPGPGVGPVLVPGPTGQAPPSAVPVPPSGDVLATDAPITLEGPACVPADTSLGDFQGYRYSAGALEWIPGGGDQFGMFSIDWDHYQKAGVASGLSAGLGFHFLSGPDQSDMPARLYDFSLGYQMRNQFGPFAFDLATSVLAASDFEGSARKGILFPSHAVGFLTVRPGFDLVFGVDFLDRGDIKLLPVAGVIWMPSPEMRFEMVFPRPRAVFQITDSYRLYLSGELGGGTWAIERVTLGNDLATYRDLRLCVGVERVEGGGARSAFEIGYLFDRRLIYSSGIGDMPLDDAVVLRLLTKY